ncbi:MAG: FtsX-like permease family protein [Alphaproteobacteria bacterium]|nr:MAG: FtsX-like permease family protein [Alphaproteobacteria bacterium]
MARAVSEAQDEKTGGRQSLVELRAVDARYPLYGSVGTNPPGRLADLLARRDGVWGAVADPVLLARLDIAPGAPIRIGEATFQIRAALTGEPDRATRIAAFGPHVLIARAALADTGLVLPGSLIHYHYRVRLPPGADVAALRRDLAATFPDAGWRVRDPDEAAPGVVRFIERLSLYLTFIALAVLLVGGLGVANAVRAYLERRAPTIATLKCLGAPGGLIFRVYLVQIMVLALLGVAIGIGAGAVAPFMLGTVLAEVLGWRVPAIVHVQPLAVAAALGLLSALAFCLWPLARARAIAPANLFRYAVAPATGPGFRHARTTVAVIAAIAVILAALAVFSASERMLGAWFVVGAAAAFAVFRGVGIAVVALARRLPRPRGVALRLAVANLHRPGAATGSVVTSLGLGLTVLVAIALVEANLSRQLRDELPADAPGFYFIDIQPDQTAAFDRLIASFPGARDLRRVPILRGRIAAVNGVPPGQLTIPADIAWVFRGDRGLTWSATPPPGVDPETDLVAGAWWPPDYRGPPLVSLDAEVGEALDIGPGDRLGINILGRTVEVEIANLRRIDWSRLGINFVMVFSPGLLESAPQTYIATVKVDPAREDALERAVSERFVNVSAIRVRETLATVVTLLGRIAVALNVAGGLGLTVGVLVLAGALAAEHRRRVHDAVVLKVLGATRRDIARAFLAEYGLLGLVAAVLAGVLGTAAAYGVVGSIMHLTFRFLPVPVVATAALAAAVTLAGGFFGTWRALAHKAAAVLRNE